MLNSLRVSIEKHGITILRVSVATIFLWFGALKFVPGNAAEELAGATISWMTLGVIEREAAVYILGVFECLIGLGLLFKPALGVVVPVLYFQLLGTLVPLVAFRAETWAGPFMPTLEGQYIIKNVVLVAAAIVVGASARGSKLIVHPDVAKEAERKQEEMLEENV